MSRGRSLRGRSKSAIPELLRGDVTRRGEELVARKFSPLVDPDRARSHGFNYPVAVFTEWRGRSFHLCVRYRTPPGRAAEDFVVRTTRVEYAGRDRFHLAYFRHTNRWQPVYHGLTLDQCFEAIEEEEVFLFLT